MNGYPGHVARWLALASLLAACTAPPTRPAGLVNPASAYCHARGGTVVLSYSADGRQGLCFLPDGRLVDEEQLYRADHSCP